MHISVWKSLLFLQASRQKNNKKEGRKWLAGGFYKKFHLLQKFMQKFPSFTKIHAKTSIFYKKVQKIQKNFPLLQKNFPLLQKKLPSFTKNQKKQNFPLLQKTKKTKKPKCFGGFKSAIRSGM